MTTTAYSLKGMTISYVLPISGFGEGNAIEIEPTGPMFASVQGVDGSHAFAYTGMKSAKWKVRLLQTSAMNNIFSSVLNANLVALEAGGGATMLPFTVKDNNGLDFFFCPACLIMAPPKMPRGAKVETQEWEFEGGDCKWYLGGNGG